MRKGYTDSHTEGYTSGYTGSYTERYTSGYTKCYTMIVKCVQIVCKMCNVYRICAHTESIDICHTLCYTSGGKK
jgi:hypothetical protein